MIMPKISVIIPVYGVELYLDKCIESVVNQTYRNLEIILVDDGSPDRCPTICDEWAELDNRIKVIHKKNGGLSDARNAGIRIASGELIGFVDSDDWISEGMYQLLYENMIENNSDISACGVEMVWEDKNLRKRLTPKGQYVLDCREAIEAIIKESILKQPVWYKLYKSELIRNIFFPEGKCHEDVFWSYQAIGKANKISVFDTPCYYYYQRKNSIMGNTFSLKRLDLLDAKYERLKYLETYFCELVGLAKWDLWFSSVYAVQMSLRFLSAEEYQQVRKKVEKIRKDIEPVPLLKNTSLKQKIWFILSTICFELTCRLRNLLKVGL